ncbi:MAG TPA: hypothetical protein VND96_17510 [Candidatus Micrarchaeaceae archaeon]|nr:hypothetical protein [Candidatus Micrarchaeaceae archaeon]
MRSARSVLALRYTPVSVTGGVRKAVGGFVRYVQFRDQHVEPEKGGLDAYMRYVAHRDRTSPGGRVFGSHEDREVDRRRFVSYVARSVKNLEPNWVQGRDGKRVDRQRAVYTFVLSPEEWRGLDLRRLARAAMKQLERDAGGGGIGPWFGAEHRNTAHHHVHIVLAARRELAPGKFSTLVINRQRLQRMKEAIALEIGYQRRLDVERDRGGRTSPQSKSAAQPYPRAEAVTGWRAQPARRPNQRRGLRSSRHYSSGRVFAAALGRLRGAALIYHHQMERELEEARNRNEHEGWLR